MRNPSPQRPPRGRSATRNPQPATRSGFTLVELLVVIAIIGALTALLLPAIAMARAAAQRAKMKTEITQLDAAFEDAKNSSGSYPPNAQTDAGGPLNDATVLANFKRHFNKAFPQHREPDELIEADQGLAAIAPGDVSALTPGAAIPEATNLEGGMNAAEAIVFWMGGFSSDPKYPISGPGGPSYSDQSDLQDPQAAADPVQERQWSLSVDVGRLGPRDENSGYFDQTGVRYLVYNDPRDTSRYRRINFWYYSQPNRDTPYVYFDASRGKVTEETDAPAHTVLDNSAAANATVLDALVNVRPIKTPNPVANSDLFLLANDGKFQILAAGVDGDWGQFPAAQGTDATAVTLNPDLSFPAGPWTLEIADTLTNFTDDTLEQATP